MMAGMPTILEWVSLRAGACSYFHAVSLLISNFSPILMRKK